MMHEPDGVAEAFEETLKIALSTAGELARAHAIARAERLREARAESEHREREVRAEIEANRAAARVKLSTVTEPQWWDRASEQQITAAWETAVKWRQSDPQAAQAAVRIRAEVEHRFGIDLDHTPASDVGVAIINVGQGRASPGATGAALVDLAESRKIVEISHAHSVREAAAQAPRHAPRARKSRGPGRGTGVERDRGR
jgi:hypothetical protein